MRGQRCFCVVKRLRAKQGKEHAHSLRVQGVVGMRVLLIEDNDRVVRFITAGLEELGHRVDRAGSGQLGLTLASSGPYDVLIVDRLLPGKMDGLSVVEALRNAGKRTPILILSALGQVDDRILGLRRGADDYLSKPFSLDELLARLEALVRRAPADTQPTTLSVGNLQADLLSREVHRGDRPIELQPREFKLLVYLMRHSGQVVTRDMLLNEVWEHQSDPQSNVIDVHVSKLRQKIDHQFEPPLLHTVRNRGYRLSA
jgi:two-component system, OmpR family, response regulator